MSGHPAATCLLADKFYTQKLFAACRKLRFWILFGHWVKKPEGGDGSAFWLELENQYGFKECVLEFSDGSNGTAELNCLAIQAAPVGAQLGTASLNSWTTGTECKAISFQQVRLYTSKYTSCITSSVVSTNLCTWQPVVKIYFLEFVYTKAIRFNNRFVDFAIIADKCISYILMQYCQPHHIF